MKKLVDAYLNFNLSVITMLKVFATSKFGLKKPKALSKDIVIIGTGPSLKNVLENQRSYLQDKDLMAVNFFYKTEFFTELKPKFYITTAQELWEDSSNEHYKKLGDDLFQSIEKNVTWEMTYFLPISARKFARWKGILNNPNVKVFYYNTTVAEGLKFTTRYYTRRGLAFPRAHNVLAHGILNSWWMGYKRMYLIGADHTFFDGLKVNDKSEFVARNEHFYDKEKDAFRKISVDDVYTKKLHDHVRKLYLTFKGYWDIKEIIERYDVKVYNLTADSMIDAFEKRELTEEFKK